MMLLMVQGPHCQPKKKHAQCKWWFSCSVMSDSWNPMDCSLPWSPVHGILQARILEWVAISFSENWTWGLNPDLLHCRWIGCELGFIGGQNEDYSLEHSISNGSEKLLQRRSREDQYIHEILVSGEYMQSSIYFFWQVTASHEEQMSPWRILMLFYNR